MGEWNPIETAPKDRPILLWYPTPEAPNDTRFYGIIEGWWHQVYEEPDEQADGWETPVGHIGGPTHWMNQPSPPTS